MPSSSLCPVGQAVRRMLRACVVAGLAFACGAAVRSAAAQAPGYGRPARPGAAAADFAPDIDSDEPAGSAGVELANRLESFEEQYGQDDLRLLVRQYVREEQARLAAEQGEDDGEGDIDGARQASYDYANFGNLAAPGGGGGGGSGNDLSMTASWHNGFEAQTRDKRFRVHVGGRVQFDSSWYAVDSAVQDDPTIINRYEDGSDFRRARIRVDGTMYEQIDWAMEYDFMNSVRPVGTLTSIPVPTDLWVTFTKLPYVGNVRVGNQKPAIGFEHLVSSRFLPFMERSFNQDTFYGGFFNGFEPGISAFDTALDEHMTWNVGWYKPTNSAYGSSAASGESQVVGRLTALPYYDGPDRLIHFGVSGLNSSTVNDRVRYRTRGPIRAGLASEWPVPADTVLFHADTFQTVNAEFAAVFGRMTLQAEYLGNWTQGAGPVDRETVGTLFYHGGYAQILFYLTDDHDNYNRKTGVFDRVTPSESWRCKDENGCRVHGCGAWQVGVRYNFLDLDDKGQDGGILDDVTVGLNWFLNPNMKVQWNYSATHRDRSGAFGTGDGLIQGFGMRLAHDF